MLLYQRPGGALQGYLHNKSVPGFGALGVFGVGQSLARLGNPRENLDGSASCRRPTGSSSGSQILDSGSQIPDLDSQTRISDPRRLNSRIRDPGIPDPYPGWPDWPGCLGGLESGQSGLPERDWALARHGQARPGEARHGQARPGGENRGWALLPLRLPLNEASLQ